MVKHSNEGHQVVEWLVPDTKVEGLFTDTRVWGVCDAGSGSCRSLGIWFDTGDLAHDGREPAQKVPCSTPDI